MSEDGSKVARWGSRWGLIVFLWVAFALAYMARQSLYSIFPVLRAELGFTEMQLALTTTVFGWVYGVANAFGGGVADRVSKQRLIAASLLCSAGALALTGLASTPEWLLAGRSLMGLACRAQWPRYHPSRRRTCRGRSSGRFRSVAGTRQDPAARERDAHIGLQSGISTPHREACN